MLQLNFNKHRLYNAASSRGRFIVKNTLTHTLLLLFIYPKTKQKLNVTHGKDKITTQPRHHNRQKFKSIQHKKVK